MGLGIPTVHHKDDFALKSRLKIINKHYDLRGKKVIDIGCGNGFYTLEIAKIADFVTGIDINEESIEQANTLSKQEQISNVAFKCTDIEKLDIKEKFDAVLMIEVLEHLPDVENTLNKINHWLKDEGVLILFVPNKLYPFETHGARLFGRCLHLYGSFPFLSWAPDWLRKYFVAEKIFTVNSLKKILRPGRFQVTDVDYYFPPLDLINIRVARVGRFIFSKFERTFLRKFGISIFCVAKKIP